jgi:hypothetical protein
MTENSYGDVMAQALAKVGWPTDPPNLESIPIPDAIQAVSGYECVEKYNRAKHSEMNVPEVAQWLTDHKWNRHPHNSTTIPIVFQTVESGAKTLKSNHAYAVGSWSRQGS